MCSPLEKNSTTCGPFESQPLSLTSPPHRPFPPSTTARLVSHFPLQVSLREEPHSQRSAM
ncbi:hypothetical protein L210DRAFT_3552415 [Boletus edulis BED1]|uniref:Uncharacterized protein n=1 Tax=Boletus edulis BED1 TaxID=1328754 RepID=A0AAD4BBG5_BOLED|nr:hypothetical protein L210DRAFT_3582146 [Boletus edulis BED1]KAF8434809.1 hypothetical protein L210DRAFT_3552415 [Boletus edulis BED1]